MAPRRWPPMSGRTDRPGGQARAKGGQRFLVAAQPPVEVAVERQHDSRSNRSPWASQSRIASLDVRRGLVWATQEAVTSGDHPEHLHLLEHGRQRPRYSRERPRCSGQCGIVVAGMIAMAARGKVPGRSVCRGPLGCRSAPRAARQAAGRALGVVALTGEVRCGRQGTAEGGETSSARSASARANHRAPLVERAGGGPVPGTSSPAPGRW